MLGTYVTGTPALAHIPSNIQISSNNIRTNKLISLMFRIVGFRDCMRIATFWKPRKNNCKECDNI